MDTPPSQTIYVSNIFDKIGKVELKKMLHCLFSQFGRILDIVCVKSKALRGQAWVVFGDVASATNAMSNLQGFPFYDKPMRIQYAKGKSDVVAKREGSFPQKGKDAKKKKIGPTGVKVEKDGGKKGVAPTSKAQEESARGGPAGSSDEGGKADRAPPNKILFVENLPEGTNEDMLGMLFKQYPGYKEVRMVESRPGIAFVEFEMSQQGGLAIDGLQGFKIDPQHSMKISYAKQ